MRQLREDHPRLKVRGVCDNRGLGIGVGPIKVFRSRRPFCAQHQSKGVLPPGASSQDRINQRLRLGVPEDQGCKQLTRFFQFYLYRYLIVLVCVLPLLTNELMKNR